MKFGDKFKRALGLDAEYIDDEDVGYEDEEEEELASPEPPRRKATAIADELLERRTVVLNLEATAKDEAGKLICFLSGVAYSNGGKLKKIANNTYIITPYNVDVMGDLLDELENNGMFFV